MRMCVCVRACTKCAYVCVCFWCYFYMLLTRILLYNSLKSYRIHNCFFSSHHASWHRMFMYDFSLVFCMLSAVSHHIKSVFHKTSSQTISVNVLVHCLFLAGCFRRCAVCSLFASINLVPLPAFVHIIHVLRYKYNLSPCWLKTLFTIHHMHFADKFFRGQL